MGLRWGLGAARGSGLGLAIARTIVVVCALGSSLLFVHAHDIVTFADEDGIALRGGHHCNQPLMKKLGVDIRENASVEGILVEGAGH